MASVQPATPRLQPHHVKLEVECLAERLLAIRVRLDDPYRGDEELQKAFMDPCLGLDLLTAFALVRFDDVYCDEPYTSSSIPLNRPFLKKFGVFPVWEETTLNFLQYEVSYQSSQ